MALIKYGGGIVQMSGSIAGNTHARNRYGNYMRARTKPVNPNSPDQVAVRSALAYLTEVWLDECSAAQRAAWATYAAAIAMKNKLGETIKLSGFNHFIRSNSNRARWGFAPILAGPVVLTLPEHDPAFSIAISAAPPNQVVVTYDDTLDWCDETGGSMWLLQGTPQNGTRNFFAGPWRRILRISGDAVAPPTTPHTTDLWTPAGEGQKVWLKARIERMDARISEPFTAECTVTA